MRLEKQGRFTGTPLRLLINFIFGNSKIQKASILATS